MDNNYDTDTSTFDDEPQWLTPWTYPTRICAGMALAIARDVLYGATLNAAGMKQGVAPKRIKQWLRWGEEAYDRGADGNDLHADYLDLYIKVLQAVGAVAVRAQQRALAMNPTWWIAHNPETRGEWGGDAEQAVVSAKAVIDADVVVELPPPPKADTAKMRTVMKMLIESGATIEQALDQQAQAESDEGRDAI